MASTNWEFGARPLPVKGGWESEGPRQSEATMLSARGLFGRGIGVCGAVLLVVVGLPVLAIATVLLRPVLLGAVVIALVGGAALYCEHPNARCWLERHLGRQEAG